MSSPSAYYVDVQANQRREEAARRASIEAATALLDTLRQLRAQALALARSGEAGEAVEIPFVADVSLTDAREAIEAWILVGQRAADVLRSGIAQANARRADRRLLESLRRRAGGRAIRVEDVVADLPARAGPPTEAAADPEPDTDWQLQAVEEAARLSGRLGDRIFEDDRDAVAAMIGQLAETERRSQTAIRLDRLRLAVQQALERGATRSQDRAEALELLQQLRGLDHPDLGPTAAALRRVVDGRHPLEADVRAESRRILAAATTAADDQYAMDTVAAAFADLGYAVQPGFATELVERGAAEFRSARWLEYGVRVHVGRDRRLRTHLVRYGAAEESAEGDRRERSVTQTFCEDLDRVAEATEEVGVVLRASEQHPPGTMPVMVVPLHGESSDRHRSAAKPKPKEKRL